VSLSGYRLFTGVEERWEFMKGRIDSDGNLYRDGKKQYCPFAPLRGGAFTQCGDWCPHFSSASSLIHLCQDGLLSFKELTDERGADEPI